LLVSLELAGLHAGLASEEHAGLHSCLLASSRFFVLASFRSALMPCLLVSREGS